MSKCLGNLECENVSRIFAPPFDSSRNVVVSNLEWPEIVLIELQDGSWVLDEVTHIVGQELAGAWRFTVYPDFWSAVAAWEARKS